MVRDTCLSPKKGVDMASFGPCFRVEFAKYNFPKAVEDDVKEFPTVARIPDAMLKKVDPSNSVLMAYMQIEPKKTTSPAKKKSGEGDKISKKKKCHAEDVANLISKIQKKRKLVIQEDSMDDEIVPESPLVTLSPKRNSPTKLIFEEIGCYASSVTTFVVDTTTNLGDSAMQSTPEQTTIISPEVSLTKSSYEEV
ncbi:unnamed protein product [Lactuca saligna]|uniref:Uncharacterized protein n=1 Tax=Lactuca saligna TaxID=75948 RepID=A0AA36E1K7_LACSI|nr:unnamed protein product [Lactuca saligna]